jgi:putative membrane protein
MFRIWSTPFMNTAPASTLQKFKSAAGITARGFCMGAADVVPGVSGGTMAFILGIYPRFVNAIKSFDLAWAAAVLRLDWRQALTRPDLTFLVPLGTGIFLALMFFTRVVPLPQLLLSHPAEVYGLFFGLILGSIFILLGGLKHWQIRDLAPLLLGLLGGALVVTAVPAETPQTWWFVMFSGALAICAMVVPGISGSFVLLLLGQYAYILDALGHFNFAVIAPFAVGAALGLFAFTRLLSWFLHHYERVALLAISGVLCASMWVIWPFQERIYADVRGKSRLVEASPAWPDLGSNTLTVAGLALAGLLLVMALNYFATRTTRAHN